MSSAQAAADALAPAKELAHLAQQFVERRTQALVAGAAPQIAALDNGTAYETRAVYAAESVGVEKLAGYRDALRGIGEAYAKHESSVTIVGVEVSGRTAVLTVDEDSTLHYARIRGAEPTVTSWLAPREFTYEQRGAGWALTGQRLLGGGVPPVNDPPAVTAEEARKALAELPAADLAERAAVQSGPAITGTFNRSAAAAYATRHAKSYNTAYRRFSDVGGDCTNFVSQSMRAGGWPNDLGWYRDATNWWYNAGGETWSWVNVAHWHSFAAVHSKRTTLMSGARSLVAGEVLQADFTNNGSKDHSMMVTLRQNGEVYLSYHTTDTLNRSYASIAAAYPRARWLPHFVKTTY
ncbi:amidase domain-containing protein [Actinokineospora guangxiensis]|uniref:Amidase domain-containing protein n=1 Tax=Actinokineospora guangxiensis TaxID=1490288 RepID=A0ABW0ESV4_9PSEU